MTAAAIIETQFEQLADEAIALRRAVRDAEVAAEDFEKKAASSREAAQLRRLELGRVLLRAREHLPRRGTKERGWGAFLAAVEIDEATAWRYMKLAGGEAATFQADPLKDSEPDAGDDRDVPPPSDADAPIAGGEPEVEIDRDTWCTPKWIADAIGEWDLDPCSNERSHIRAALAYDLDRRGEDGLALAGAHTSKERVFINPPYSDVRPWIDAYADTRFCFLLKLDPSTKWFARLLELAAIVLVPRGTRIEFEAPPGVPPDKQHANPFPHALFYARANDATPAIRALCFPPWRIK